MAQKKQQSWLDRLKGGAANIFLGPTGAKTFAGTQRLLNPTSTPQTSFNYSDTGRSTPNQLFPRQNALPQPPDWQQKLFPLATADMSRGGGGMTQSAQSTAEVVYGPQKPSTIGQSDKAPYTPPATAKTNYVPPAGGGGGPAPTPTPTPRNIAEEVALNRLLLERDQTAQGETQYNFPEPDKYDPATYNPLTIQEIDTLIDQARNKAGFLTEREIQSLEDQRKDAIAAIIDREATVSKNRRTEEGNRIIRGTEALYTNMGGGPANINSGTIDKVQLEMDKLDQAIELLDQQRIDDLTKNDITSAQRVEDRINELFRRKNELDANRLDQIVKSEQSRQFGAEFDENSRQFAANYGIDVGNLQVDQQEAVTNILKMQKTDALDAAKFLVQNFGSMATEGLDLAEIAALEQAAQLPFGSLMRSLQSIDEKKANQLEFISGTKYQQPGSFDKNTGLFTPISSALRYIDESGGGADAGKAFADLPADMQQALLSGYESAPDKDKFITQTRETLGKEIAGALLIGGGQSAYRNQPDKATQFAQVSTDVKAAFDSDPDMTLDVAEEVFRSRGLDINEAPVKEFLKNYEPDPWWKVWK